MSVNTGSELTVVVKVEEAFCGRKGAKSDVCAYYIANQVLIFLKVDMH